jgi:hypothetical protein
MNSDRISLLEFTLKLPPRILKRINAATKIDMPPLPSELILETVKLVDDYASFSRLIQTSRHMKSIAEPILYADLNVSDSGLFAFHDAQILKLLDHIIRSPHHASLVRRLRVVHDHRFPCDIGQSILCSGENHVTLSLFH